jgi:hypothetical protein
MEHATDRHTWIKIIAYAIAIPIVTYGDIRVYKTPMRHFFGWSHRAQFRERSFTIGTFSEVFRAILITLFGPRVTQHNVEIRHDNMKKDNDSELEVRAGA